MNLFKLSLRLNGYNIPAARARLRENASKDLHVKVARFHLEHNPFYQDFTGEKTLKSWEALPVLKKRDLQIPLDKRLSEGYHFKNIYKGSTSGSSGKPFTFAKDKFTHALSWASFYDAYDQYNIDLSQDLQARFYGIPLRGRAHYQERFKDFVSGRYRFPIFDLSEWAMMQFLKQFKKSAFTYLNGYTSSILRFSEFLQTQDIVLKEVCPHLKLAIVTSEMLFEKDRKLIQNALGVPVINEYGASETGLIAFENSQNKLIIDDKLLYVEVLDDAGKVLPYGEKGRIVITSLYNKAHPFIRYEIGDLGTLQKDTESGKIYIEKLHGRTSDFVYLPSGKTVPGLAFYYVTKKAMQSTASISEFIVKQTHRDHFIVHYVSIKQLSEKEEKELLYEMIAYLEPGITVNFIRVDQLKRSKSGKLKQFTGLAHP